MYKITTYITCAFVISNLSIFAQVGIGTTTPDPSSVLDISSNSKGVLFPQLTSSEINDIVNPANGLILYNTDTNDLEYNSGTSGLPSWNTVASNSSFKCSNTNTTTNLNVNTPSNMPLYGSLNWNDDDTTYSIVTPNTVTVSKSGRYRIVCNISLLGINSSGSTEVRTAVEAYVAINGVQVGAVASSGYIRYANGQKNSSLHINEVLNLSAGDIISIASHRSANSGTVRFRSSGSSNILIEKIK